MVAYHFAPVNVSGTHRAIHFARALADAGHDVNVLTGSAEEAPRVDEGLLEVFPFPTRIHRVRKRPTSGETLAQLGRLIGGKQRAADSGPSKQSVSPGRTSGPRRFFQLLDLIPDRHRGWYRPAMSLGRALAATRPFDIVVATGPPWTALQVASRLARYGSSRLILDFRDPWSFGSGGTSAEVWDQRVQRWLEGRVIRAADGLIFNSPTLAELARKRSGTPDPYVRTILNGSNAPRNTERRALRPDKPLLFRHFGSLYGARSLAPLSELISRAVPDQTAIRVEQFGTVDAESVDGTHSNACSVHAPVPFAEAIRKMREPAVLVLVQPVEFLHQIPTKLYDYLSTGNPVLVMAPEDSAAWGVAREFERSVLGEQASDGASLALVRSLVERWRDGRLWQVPADDSHHLKKSILNEQLLDIVEEIAAKGADRTPRTLSAH